LARNAGKDAANWPLPGAGKGQNCVKTGPILAVAFRARIA